MTVPVRDAREHEREPIAQMLARAFADDPAMRYIFPDRARRITRLPRFFRLFFTTDARGMRLVTDELDAATFWRPPGQAEDRKRDVVRHLPALLGIFGLALPRAMRVGDAIAAHQPRTPFWHLHYAGVDPASQGKGRGGAVIRAGLERADHEGVPAYLETATPGNVPLYRSLGFEVIAEWDVPKGGPHFWSMLRPQP